MTMLASRPPLMTIFTVSQCPRGGTLQERPSTKMLEYQDHHKNKEASEQDQEASEQDQEASERDQNEMENTNKKILTTGPE